MTLANARLSGFATSSYQARTKIAKTLRSLNPLIAWLDTHVGRGE